MGHQRERDTERARQTLPREGPTLHLDHGAAVLHLETKGIRQSIARAFLRVDGESAQSQINHSDDDHTHTHTLTPPPLPMRIDPRANHSGSRVPLNGSILLPPALYSNGVPSNLEVSVLGSVRLCMSMYNMYVLLKK